MLSGRLREGQPLLEEALGLVLLCAGIGLWLDVSFLLSAVVMGAGLTVVAYIVIRTAGKAAGGWLGATTAHSTRATASTVVFELAGPLFTRLAIRRAA